MLRSLEAKDNITLHKEFGKLNMDLILTKSDEMKCLAVLEKENEDDLIFTIKLLLINLTESINVVRNMSRPQIDDCTMFIINEFKNLKLEEVYIVINKIKTGEVKILDRLDPQIVLQEFRKYFEARTNRAAELNDMKHTQQKSLGDNTRSSGKEEDREAHHKAHVGYLLSQANKNNPGPNCE